MLERRQSLLQYYNNIASWQDWYSADHGTHTTQPDDTRDRTSAESSRRRRRRTEIRNRQLSELVVNVDTGAKLSETIGAVKELSTSHDEWTMAGEEERGRRRDARNVQRITE